MANTLDEKEARQLVKNWSEAEVQGNVAALQEMLDEDYLGIGPRGFMLTKEQWLQRYASGELKNESLNFEIDKIRTYGDTTLLTGMHKQTTFYKGQPVPGEFRSTMVFVKQPSSQQGGWKLVSVQLSPIMQPPSMPQPQPGN